MIAQSKHLQDGFIWNQYSARIATITHDSANFRVCYFQFPDRDGARSFWQSIVGKHCSRAQVRQAERFDTGWEVKIWNMPERVLASLIRRERNRKQPQQALPLPQVRRDWSVSESHTAMPSAVREATIAQEAA